MLAALWNHSRQQGMSVLDTRGAVGKVMTKEQAQEIINSLGSCGFGQHLNFDYLWGRVLKVDLAPNEIDLRLYNRDNGDGAGEKAIDSIL